MSSYKWVGDVGEVRFRVSILGDDSGMATVSRWSSECEDYVESCTCSVLEIRTVMERMLKPSPTGIRSTDAMAEALQRLA
jgi:hypothetical protein